MSLQQQFFFLRAAHEVCSALSSRHVRIKIPTSTPAHQYQFLLARCACSLHVLHKSFIIWCGGRARIKNYEAIYQAECAVSLLLRSGVEINPKIWPPPGTDDFRGRAEKQAAKTSWRKRSRGWAQHKSRRPRARCAKTHTRLPAFAVFHVRACGNLAGSVSKGYCGRRFYLFAIKALIKSLWNILAVWNPCAPLICDPLATQTNPAKYIGPFQAQNKPTTWKQFSWINIWTICMFLSTVPLPQKYEPVKFKSGMIKFITFDSCKLLFWMRKWHFRFGLESGRGIVIFTHASPLEVQKHKGRNAFPHFSNANICRQYFNSEETESKL